MLALSVAQQAQTETWEKRCTGYNYSFRKFCSPDCVRCEEQKRFQSLAASYVGSYGNEFGTCNELAKGIF